MFGQKRHRLGNLIATSQYPVVRSPSYRSHPYICMSRYAQPAPLCAQPAHGPARPYATQPLLSDELFYLLWIRTESTHIGLVYTNICNSGINARPPAVQSAWFRSFSLADSVPDMAIAPVANTFSVTLRGSLTWLIVIIRSVDVQSCNFGTSLYITTHSPIVARRWLIATLQKTSSRESTYLQCIHAPPSDFSCPTRRRYVRNQYITQLGWPDQSLMIYDRWMRRQRRAADKDVQSISNKLSLVNFPLELTCGCSQSAKRVSINTQLTIKTWHFIFDYNFGQS